MAITLENPARPINPIRTVFDFSRLSKDEIDTELQLGWDDIQHGRTISLENSIKNYKQRHLV